jgi:hypothetical protein
MKLKEKDSRRGFDFPLLHLSKLVIVYLGGGDLAIDWVKSIEMDSPAM